MANVTQTNLDVTGMTCGSCVRRIDNALKGIKGVREIQVNLSEGKVQISHDQTAAIVESLIAALAQAGYMAALAAS